MVPSDGCGATESAQVPARVWALSCLPLESHMHALLLPGCGEIQGPLTWGQKYTHCEDSPEAEWNAVLIYKTRLFIRNAFPNLPLECLWGTVVSFNFWLLYAT